jgi:hypothetical protein
MGTEMVPETLVSSWNQLTRLIAREDFIEFSRREDFESYMTYFTPKLCGVVTHKATLDIFTAVRNSSLKLSYVLYFVHTVKARTLSVSMCQPPKYSANVETFYWGFH